MKLKHGNMEFFYNPDPNCPLTEKEQEYYYCLLRDSIRRNHKSISLVKRVYSIKIVFEDLIPDYTVGENASAIFESDEFIHPPSFYIFANGRGFWLSPSENSVIIEYFEPIKKVLNFENSVQ